MKILRHYLLCLGLLLAVVGCKKDKAEPVPTKTDLLTAKAWKDQSQTLRLNTVEGTRPLAPADLVSYQFGRDGKVTIGPANGTGMPGTTTTGTWSWSSNETQLSLMANGSAETLEVFELTAGRLVFGYTYNQAQIQQAVNNLNSTSRLTLLLLSTNQFTFPAGTPTIPAAQLTSIVWKFSTVPR